MKSARVTIQTEKKIEDVILKIVYILGPGKGWAILKEEDQSSIMLIMQSHENQQDEMGSFEKEMATKDGEFKENEDSKTFPLCLLKRRTWKQQ